MEKAMLRNMLEKTGKNTEDWIALVDAKTFSKHGEIVNYLKFLRVRWCFVTSLV